MSEHKLESSLYTPVPHILIVDDEKDICELLADILEDEGFVPHCAHTGAEALKAITQKLPNLVIQDIWLNDPHYDGLKILDHLKKWHPEIPVIMMSGHGTIETAVQAIKKGAYDFIEKPFKADRLLVMIQRALEACQMARENAELKGLLGLQEELVGESNAVKTLKIEVERLAGSNCRILMTGPFGVGKKTLARYIHSHSSRKRGPFLTLNCLSLEKEDLEKTLWGVEDKSKSFNGFQKGLLERAHGGTLVLEEVSALPKQVQNTLTKVLHDLFLERSQENLKIKVKLDVRIMATSSKDLGGLVKQGLFREDLYHRLKVSSLYIPALKERSEDILPLVYYFTHRLAPSLGKIPCSFDEQASRLLMQASWPGNSRQLRTLVEYLLITYGSSHHEVQISPEHLPLQGEALYAPSESADNANHPPLLVDKKILDLSLKEAREQFERDYLKVQVSRFSGNISQTAEFVGMERSALHRKLRTLDVKRSS